MTRVIFRRTPDGATFSGMGHDRVEMSDLEQRIARLAEDLRRIEEEMRRSGLTVSPEMAPMRRWEPGRSLASFYQRWHDFLAVYASGYRHLGRPLVHGPRPD